MFACVVRQQLPQHTAVTARHSTCSTQLLGLRCRLPSLPLSPSLPPLLLLILHLSLPTPLSSTQPHCSSVMSSDAASAFSAANELFLADDFDSAAPLFDEACRLAPHVTSYTLNRAANSIKRKDYTGQRRTRCRTPQSASVRAAELCLSAVSVSPSRLQALWLTATRCWWWSLRLQWPCTAAAPLSSSSTATRRRRWPSRRRSRRAASRLSSG